MLRIRTDKCYTDADDHFLQAAIVQTLDNAIHRINRYPADKRYRKQTTLFTG